MCGNDLIRGIAQRIRGELFEACAHKAKPGNILRTRICRFDRGKCRLAVHGFQFLAEPAGFLRKCFGFVYDILPAGGFYDLSDFGKQGFRSAEFIKRVKTGKHLDPAHAGGDGGFGSDAEQTEPARAGDMSTAAKLLGKIAHGNDTDLIAVFFAEERHCAICACFIR